VYTAVAVKPPDHDSSQSSIPCFKRHKIANTGFVQPPPIINNKYISRRGFLESLQEHVNAGNVPNG
jgi:hypothetical protein